MRRRRRFVASRQAHATRVLVALMGGAGIRHCGCCGGVCASLLLPLAGCSGPLCLARGSNVPRRQSGVIGQRKEAEEFV